MAAINFPASPSNGDTHQGFVYNSTLGVWQSAGAQTAVTSFTGLSDTPSTLGTAGQIAKVNSGATALEFADQSGVTVYANVDALPSSGNTGDLAFVSGTNRLYIWNGSGWYNIALINTTPTISGVSSSYTFATDGTPIVITITATDPEGLPITYDLASDTSGNTATVVQGTGANTNIFTITPSTDENDNGTFSLTFRASDGVNIATAPASFTLNIIVVVENSNYTSALFTTGSSTNNNTFVDSSTNSHTITAAGNATHLSLSPYRHGGYSTYFDGTGDYITAPTNTSFDFSTGDFTIEAWINIPDVTSTWLAFISRGYSQNGGWRLYKNTGNNNLRFYYTDSGTTSYIEASSTGLTNNTWHHITVVRNSSTTKIYVDGVEKGSGTISTSLNPGSYAIEIGSGVVTSSFPITGYMTDVRIVKGTAVYTSAFTPPIERLTAIANTSLLTCHLPYIADGSTNDHSITLNGDVRTEAWSPYDKDPYNTAENGGSIYFDGSSRVEAPDSADWKQDADFTIEAWVRPTSHPNQYSHIFGQWQSGGGTNRNHQISMDPNGRIIVSVNRSNTNYSTPTGSLLQLNTWHHIAITLNGTSLIVWVNGKNDVSTTVAGTANDSTVGFAVGAEPSSGNFGFPGFIADTRVVKGSAIYTANFTPPTAPLTAITNTKLLLNGTNAGIIDKSQLSSQLILDADTKCSSTQAKYRSTAIYTDGTGDRIRFQVENSKLATSWGVGGQPFTVEWWQYDEMPYTTNHIVGPNTGGGAGGWNTTNGHEWLTFFSGSNFYLQYFGTNGSYNTITGTASTMGFVQNQWQHIAHTYDGTTWKFYIDGTEALSSNLPNVPQAVNVSFATLGGMPDNSYYAAAYYDDVRITKGLVRYTANFTPPTAAL